MSTTKIKVSNIASVTGTGNVVLSASPTFTGTLNASNISYTGTLTGSTGILNIGSGQLYKDASGNVGIGTIPTSVPSTGNPVVGANNLILYNAGNLGLTLLTDNAATRTQQIGFGSQGLSLFDAGLKYDNSSRALQLWTGGVAEKMRIDYSGNVGIGTSSPSTKLTVAGAITITGANALRGSYGGGAITSNFAAGDGALQSNTTGNYNSASGMNALLTNTTGNYNTASGFQALQNNTTGAQNTASGMNALQSNTTGNYNSASGQAALLSNTTGSGNSAFNPLNSAGTYAPVFNPTTENNRFCMGSTGVTNAYIQVAWTVVSDARDKTNFAPVPHGLDFVNQLQPTAYQFKEDRETDVATGVVRYGFKAQDILALEGDTPVIIDTEDLDKLRFNSDSLIPVLVNAIKELTARLELLEGK